MRKLSNGVGCPLTGRYVLWGNLGMRRIRLVALFLSIVQAYGSYLLHNDLINIEILKWIFSIVYIPLYLILLCIGGLLELMFGCVVVR